MAGEGSIQNMMFGTENEPTPACDDAKFKGFMSAPNADRKAEVLQSQLVSLAQSAPAFDLLGHSISDLGVVSVALVDRNIFSIRDLVQATSLFKGETPTWNPTEKVAERSVAVFLQEHMFAWRGIIMQ